MLSPELQATLQRAVEDVRGRNHEYLTLEHLLLAILDDPSGADIVTIVKDRDVGVNIRRVGEDMRKGATVLTEGTELGAARRRFLPLIPDSVWRMSGRQNREAPIFSA